MVIKCAKWMSGLDLLVMRDDFVCVYFARMLMTGIIKQMSSNFVFTRAGSSLGTLASIFSML